MLFSKKYSFLWIHLPPTTPLSDETGEGERKRGGCSRRLMVHTEREHGPTAAAPWFICHLVLMKLQTAVTHTCCHSIFLHQGLCWFVDSCDFFSFECMHACMCSFHARPFVFVYSYICWYFFSQTLYICLYLAALRSVIISSFYLYPVCRCLDIVQYLWVKFAWA